MKIGVCCGNNIENMRIAKEIGYDFIETNSGDIVKADDSLIEEMKNLGIPILSSNCFIGHRVVGPQKNDDIISEYLEKLFSRASYLGIETLVFGSSGARKMIEGEGLTIDDCRNQIVDFLKYQVSPLAEKYGIMISIEPLRSKEDNAINFISDGVMIAEKVDSPNIRVLADVKHMYDQNESMSEIEKYKEWLIHGHTSNPEGNEKHNRIYPKITDSFKQDDFILPLIRAGVKNVAIEAGVMDFKTDAEQAYEVLKKYKNM